MSEENRVYYDDFAAGYERERGRGYHALLDELEAGIVEPLARGRDVLEVGCGTGLVLTRVASARRLHGVDLSPGMIRKAAARGFDVSVASATELPFADDTFDLAFSFKVLAHVPDLPKALSEMARVVRPGGHVVAELYNPYSLRFLAKRLGGPGAISDARTEADVYTRWDPPSVLRRAAPASLELVEVVGVRVLTPAAFVHRIPLLGAALRSAEHVAARSPLRWFGGFLVGVYRKPT
ncbi:MAG: class I SAM-dependent methyltransferase [Sandaracinus sp.]|nr:class I SAM-dependent methyltransferase [Sandaracinus sp.]MCB9615370.1 class I SAM-dependent methyltransferase [Sandaracinus sp.]MCB9634960.1 class I SAM-dependent methyltransferase [Sandaracinus sp.]